MGVLKNSLEFGRSLAGFSLVGPHGKTWAYVGHQSRHRPGDDDGPVYIPKKGIVLHEPSVVAMSIADKRVLAVGRGMRKK